MARWPNDVDLAEWAGPTLSVERRAVFPDVIAAAIDATWGDLDAAKMPAQDGVEDTRCPPSVRTAVLILAAKVASRMQSPTGVIASGDLFYRVSREDPDYRMLIARYAVSAEP